MINFFRRNISIYFKNKATVFYSLIGTLMIFLLYVLFLGNLWSSMYNDIPNSAQMVDSWVMAGILSVVSITSTSGVLGIMVGDRASSVSKDIMASPVSRRSLVGGYILSANAVGMVMSLIMFVLAEVFIVAKGGSLLSIQAIISCLILLLIISLSNSSFMILFASFFKNHNAYTSTVGIVGSLIGFIAGAYIPIGIFPNWLQTILVPLPVFQASVLMRQAMLGDLLSTSMQNLSASEINNLELMFGITTKIGNTEITSFASIVILVATFVLCFSAATINLSRKDR